MKEGPRACFSGLVIIAVMCSTVPQGRVPLTQEMVTEEMLSQGAMLLAEGTCARCHSLDASGTNLGPDLTDDEWLHGDGSLEAIRTTIIFGVQRDQIKDLSRRQPMEPMGQMMLGDDQIDALAAYIWSLSRGVSTKVDVDVSASGMGRMTVLEAWFSVIKSFWDYTRLTQQ